MIVLDGRNDREKLTELLAAGEQTHLDYKASLDLADSKHRLNLVKDIVAMSNRPGGGYILIGVQDDGTPCLSSGTLDRQRFDGANLGQLVRSYTDGEIEIHPQVHDLQDGKEIVLVRIEGHRDGLPVPMAKVGQYRDAKGRDVTVFRQGDVLVREGSANVPLRHSHWPDLLATRDRMLRDQAQESVQQLIAQLVRQLRSPQAGGGPTAAPVVAGLDEATFADAVISNLEAGSDIGLKRFLLEAHNMAVSSKSTPDDVMVYLDRVTILGAQAALFGRDDEFRAAVDTLYKVYLQIRDGRGAHPSEYVEILSRAYALGSLAVRCGSWQLVRHVVQQPVDSSAGSAYVYSSWLRHGQVEASRANLFPPDRGGMLISAARALLAAHPAMRPDVPDDAVPPAADLDDTDVLLNSLCRFDLAYCIAVAAEGEGDSGGYPACAAFHQWRADFVYEAIAADPEARATLFPNSSDGQVASALLEVHESASRESWKYGGYWSGLPKAASEYVRAHLPGESAP